VHWLTDNIDWALHWPPYQNAIFLTEARILANAKIIQTVVPLRPQYLAA